MLNKKCRAVIIMKVRQRFFDEINRRLDAYVNTNSLTIEDAGYVETYRKYLKSLEAMYKAEAEAQELHEKLGAHTPKIATLYLQRLEADLITGDVSGYEPIDELVKKYSRFTV